LEMNQARQENFSVKHLQLPAPTILQKIKMTLGDYWVIKNQSNYRSLWMEQMIQAQAAAQNMTRTKLWKKVKRTEQSRNKARHVKIALRKQAVHKGLSQVMAPCSNPNTMRITHTSKKDLERACLNEARRQFTQAALTPMLQPPMVDLLGLADMDAPAFQQLLDSKFECPEMCDPYLCKLLPYLRKPECIPDLNMHMYTEYKQSWE